MFRSPVLVRDARVDDVDALLLVWHSPAADEDAAPAARQEAAASVASILSDPNQRLLVALVDGDVAGGAHLKRGSLSPVHADSAVFLMHLHVRDAFRRHGVGRSLMEATVSWAEEKDSSHVVAAASVTSRDANRFMARLGLTQMAVARGATVAALRVKLPVEPPAAARVGSRNHRNVGQVLVQRRSMRRSQTRPS